MIPGGRYLVQAREVLDNRKQPVRGRLSEAGMLFWRAYAAADLWPRELREQAEPVIRELLCLGPIGHTVAAMNDSTAQHACVDLVHFIRVAQRFDERHAA